MLFLIISVFHHFFNTASGHAFFNPAVGHAYSLNTDIREPSSMVCESFIRHGADYTRELFREAIPYSEINRMAEIVFLPRWQKLFVAAKSWKMATCNRVPW